MTAWQVLGKYPNTSTNVLAWDEKIPTRVPQSGWGSCSFVYMIHHTGTANPSLMGVSRYLQSSQVLWMSCLSLYIRCPLNPFSVCSNLGEVPNYCWGDCGNNGKCQPRHLCHKPLKYLICINVVEIQAPFHVKGSLLLMAPSQRRAFYSCKHNDLTQVLGKYLSYSVALLLKGNISILHSIYPPVVG